MEGWKATRTVMSAEAHDPPPLPSLPLFAKLANGANFFIFWGIIILINFNAYGYGLLMGAVILDDDLLQVVAPLIIFPIMLFR
jgi:hypothetical protein